MKKNKGKAVFARAEAGGLTIELVTPSRQVGHCTKKVLACGRPEAERYEIPPTVK
jgi:hypothetical protein